MNIFEQGCGFLPRNRTTDVIFLEYFWRNTEKVRRNCIAICRSIEKSMTEYKEKRCGFVCMSLKGYITVVQGLYVYTSEELKVKVDHGKDQLWAFLFFW